MCKNILKNRYKIKQIILWKPKGGTSSIWFENWINLGLIFRYQFEVHTCHVMRDIDEFLIKDGWTFSEIENYVFEYIAEHIRNNLSQIKMVNQVDKPWWTKTSIGMFRVKSAWEILRHKEESCTNFKRLWCKSLPFKFSFLAR